MFSLPFRIYRAMIEHARSASPHEACGILAGRGGKVEKIYLTSNREVSPVRYRVDPTEQFRILREVEERGWRMVGIFHSHLEAPPTPSGEDIELAYYPDVLYLILSLRDWNHPELRAFWIREGEVEEETIDLVAEEKEGGLAGDE